MKEFAVTGIPGALAATTTSVANGFVIAFADGRFSYFVSVLYPRTPPTTRPEQALSPPHTRSTGAFTGHNT